MTWFGKILAFVVFVGALVWMYFTTQAFVTRTNWKKRSDDWESAYKAAVAARQAEFDRYAAKETALKSLYGVEQKRATDYEKISKEASDAVAKTAGDMRKMQDAYAKGDVDATKLQAIVDSNLKELDTVRKRNTDLETVAVALVVETENAKKEEVKAKNAARLALAIADDNAKKVEELVARVNELKQSGGSGTASVLRNINKPPPPVLANLRGEVTDVAGELLTVSVGIDAGMAIGTVLDVYRTEGGGQYIGTVKVTSALNLFPKQAIVTFTPRRGNVPLDRLPIGELPKKGDQVRPPEALTGIKP